jgi:hypothetical protein
MLRALLAVTALCCTGCWAQYRIQPSALLHVSSVTSVEEDDGEPRRLFVSKIYAELLDGRSVTVFPEQAKRLYFDRSLDEDGDVLLRVNNDSRVIRSSSVGAIAGIAAAVAVGVWTQADCERNNVNSFGDFCASEGFAIGSALFWPGLALGSGAGVLLARQPVDVTIRVKP